MLLSSRGLCACARAAPAGAARRAARVVPRSLHGSTSEHYQSTVTLYTGQDQDGALCPDSQSAMIALLEKQVDMSNKPNDFKELYHAVIPLKDVRERAPLLLDGPTHLADASIISEYLEARYRDRGARLMPDDPAAQARVRLFVRFFGDHVVPQYQRIVHVDDPAIVEETHARLLAALEAVDQFLRLHGGSGAAGAVGPHAGWSMRDEEAGAGGPYFLGRTYTLAEVAATPWIARLAHVLPEWRGIDLLAECRRVGAHRVAEWMAACLARPSAARTDPGRDLIDGLVSSEMAHAT
ncbi:hypothetical protein Rsub_05927 [Raphidocelis subcapitata]|uniref:GST C-terminal domain-containing protein n=1 Tax=Raphidocelis subcapitata TaxID=307507 RepID=A0A2V0P7X5_9CHLO|nr:hypothetical protein Rsub_05927 [Raphidocelis subcapitata]|eukprot:GBF93195.1 hypothetical protein Rsub_05927 [Raphidocelis subcapitata]